MCIRDRINDVNGNLDSASVLITVKDTIKPIAVSKPITVFIDSTGIGFASPIDADNGSSDNCSIVTRSLTKPVFICSDIGTDSTYLVVTDLGGNQDSISVKVSVKDTMKPIILAQSLTIYLDSNGIVNTNITEYETYMKRIKAREEHGDQIRSAVKDINNLKNELREIKGLLKEIVNGS